MDEISNSQLLGPINGLKVQRSASSSSSTTSRIGLEDGATSTSLNSLRLNIPDYSYYINLGEYANRCVQDPAECTQGYSMVLWLKDNQLIDDSSERPHIITTLAMTSNGINTRGYNIQYAGNTYMSFKMVNISIMHTVYFPFSKQTWNHLAITLPGNDKSKLH